MERLTKKELRALLESIKECYPICDLEIFPERVVSRLSKIVPTEFISYNGGNPRRRRNACATYPHAAYTTSQKKIFEPRMCEHPVVVHHGKTRDIRVSTITDFLRGRQFHRLGLDHSFIAARLALSFALRFCRALFFPNCRFRGSGQCCLLRPLSRRLFW